MKTLADLERFYQILASLGQVRGGPVRLAEAVGAPLPQSGVYFFFERTEIRSSHPDYRVVRVGTHGLVAGARSTLKGRLRQHLGQKSGGGNHRGSIFRLIVGRALIARQLVPASRSWGVAGDLRQAAAKTSLDPAVIRNDEEIIEQAVSRFLSDTLVICLAVLDESGPDSLRGMIERNAIALLSSPEAVAIDPPSADWLGHYSDRERVRRSGLWNNNHVGETYTPDFLDVFADLAEGVAG